MKRISTSLITLLLFCSVASAQTEAERWITADLAWYPANLSGYGVEAIAPFDYSTVPLADLLQQPGEQIQDEGRDLGGHSVEMRTTIGYERQIPFTLSAQETHHFSHIGR